MRGLISPGPALADFDAFHHDLTHILSKFPDLYFSSNIEKLVQFIPMMVLQFV